MVKAMRRVDDGDGTQDRDGCSSPDGDGGIWSSARVGGDTGGKD